MAGKGSLLRKYGVANPNGLSPVADGKVWERFLARRQVMLDVVLPFAVMAPILIPLFAVLVFAFWVRGDHAFAGVFVGLIGVNIFAVSAFLHARGQEDAVTAVEAAERVHLETLIESELGVARGTELAVFRAWGSFCWVTDGTLYSVDYNEASNQYSFSVRREPSQQRLSSSTWVGGARRLLQLI